jgi:hypothetical protein
MRETASQLQPFLGLNKDPGIFLRLRQETVSSVDKLIKGRLKATCLLLLGALIEKYWRYLDMSEEEVEIAEGKRTYFHRHAIE